MPTRCKRLAGPSAARQQRCPSFSFMFRPRICEKGPMTVADSALLKEIADTLAKVLRTLDRMAHEVEAIRVELTDESIPQRGRRG